MISDADLTKGWLSHQTAQIGDAYCQLARVSFAGELGWEVHCKPEDAAGIYDAVLDAGAKPFGMFALNSLRLEKGYRAWKQDLSTDYTILGGGLDRFVKWDKTEFKGKAALENERQQGPAKRFITMTVQANGHDAPYMSNIWSGDRIVGEVTSCGWGHRTGKCIALGMVEAPLAQKDTPLQIEIFGTRCDAKVEADQPLWDPENARLRA